MLTTEYQHIKSSEFAAVNKAFSKQASHYDDDDLANFILQRWRQRVYLHVEKLLQPESGILELNAGTGIDALYFASKGHQVHATDVSDGMIQQIERKIENIAGLKGELTCQQCSFTDLKLIKGSQFDHVFSNFGGLNCAKGLTSIIGQLEKLLLPKGYVTIVIMPKIAPWEWLWLLKGQFKKAFRRLGKKGSLAQLEGEYFHTNYHSYSSIVGAFGENFKPVSCESLGVLSPAPGSIQLQKRHPKFTALLEGMDKRISKVYPFKRWGDHIIVTVQFLPDEKE